MKSFYDTIGVKKTASQDEIKRAYRKKAAKIHPDRGGDHAEMAELSRAYTCLKDPVSRLTYDETGEEPKPGGPDAMANELLIEKFSDMLLLNVEFDVLSRLRQILTAERHQFAEQKKQAEQAIANVTKRRGEITVKRGANIWQQLIDQSVQGFTAAVRNCEMQIQIRDRAIEMLAEYSEIEKARPVLTVNYGAQFQQGFFGQFR